MRELGDLSPALRAWAKSRIRLVCLPPRSMRDALWKAGASIRNLEKQQLHDLSPAAWADAVQGKDVVRCRFYWKAVDENPR